MRQIKFINNGWLYNTQFKNEYINGQVNKDEFVRVDLPHTNIELPYNSVSYTHLTLPTNSRV